MEFEFFDLMLDNFKNRRSGKKPATEAFKHKKEKYMYT